MPTITKLGITPSNAPWYIASGTDRVLDRMVIEKGRPDLLSKESKEVFVRNYEACFNSTRKSTVEKTLKEIAEALGF